MPTYLILKRTGQGELDLEPTAIIRGKTAGEVGEAVKEGALKGPGDYVALSVNGMVERRVSYDAVVGDAPAAEPGQS